MNAPDLTGYRSVHAALRGAAHQLAAVVATLDRHDRRQVRALARYWDGYAAEVLVHHTIEDDHFFPALVAKVPVASEHVGRLDADHHHLDELMDVCTAAMRRMASGDPAPEAAGAFADLAAHMETHLGYEDADVLPLFERHFSAQEYEALDAQAHKALGLGKQAAFTVPFIASWVSPEVRDHLFAGAPKPFKVLWLATRGRHARLAQRALGLPAPLRQAVA
jgi:hemerythrin-like domain-containing protein